MRADKIVLPAVAGTSLMTLFSYCISQYEHENYSEPELLAAMEKNLLPKAAQHAALPAGWLTHYGVGVLITALHRHFQKESNTSSIVKNGVLLGAWSGIAGVAMWKLFFTIHPAPPLVAKSKFYYQLLWAHLVFGISVAATSQYLKTTNTTLINLP